MRYSESLDVRYLLNICNKASSSFPPLSNRRPWWSNNNCNDIIIIGRRRRRTAPGPPKPPPPPSTNTRCDTIQLLITTGRGRAYVVSQNVSKHNRHETPVLKTSIKIIFIDDDLLVLDKPCSLPVSILSNWCHCAPAIHRVCPVFVTVPKSTCREG